MILPKAGVRLEKKAKLRAYWNDLWRSGSYDRDVSPVYSLLRTDDYKGKAVVEIGCGDLSFSSRIIQEARSYVGVDFSYAAIAAAMRSEFKGRISLVCADAATSALPAGTAESIISIDTLDTLGRDFGGALARSAELMAPGGVIVFNVVHTEWHRNSVSEGMPVTSFNNGTLLEFERGEVMAFEPTGMAAALAQAGLRPEEIRTVTTHEFLKLLPYDYKGVVEGGMCHDVPYTLLVRASKTRTL